MKNQKNKNLEIEQKIMKRIRSGQIKLRSKYIFLAQKMGLNSALTLTVILAVLFCNLIFFYLKSTDSLIYLSFGKNGIFAFLESFPYLLTIMIIVFWMFAGYLVTKTEWSYKKSFKCVILGLLIFILLTGGILASTNFSQKIEEQAFLHQGPGAFFRPFLARGVQERSRGLVGEINEVNENYLIVNGPQGNQYLSIEELASPLSFNPQKGQLIIAIGERREDIFITQRMRLMGNNDCPMIKRGIRFYPHKNSNFLDSKDHFSRPQKATQECLKECVQNQGFGQSCFERCRPQQSLIFEKMK